MGSMREQSYHKIMTAILSECDEDIREMMLEVHEDPTGSHRKYALFNSPALVALEWQKLRDRNKEEDKFAYKAEHEKC